MEPKHLELVRAYFRTHDEGNEAAHMALIHPDLKYFGSVLGVETSGRPSYLGIYRSAHKDLGIAFHRAIKVFGNYPNLAVLVEVHWAAPRTGWVEAIWRMKFSEDDRVLGIEILWSPKGAVDLLTTERPSGS